MPSPVAHAGMVLLAGRWTPRSAPGRLLPSPAWSAALVFMLCLPDIDFLVARLTGIDVLGHGGALHSLLFGVLAGTLFGSIAAAVDGPWSAQRWGRWSALGVGCVWSHLLLDMFTRGGGVMLFWPLWNERIASPLTLFYGAHHSQPFAFHLHAITLSTELLFVGAVWLLARRRTQRQQRGLHDLQPAAERK